MFCNYFLLSSTCCLSLFLFQDTAPISANGNRLSFSLCFATLLWSQKLIFATIVKLFLNLYVICRSNFFLSEISWFTGIAFVWNSIFLWVPFPVYSFLNLFNYFQPRPNIFCYLLSLILSPLTSLCQSCQINCISCQEKQFSRLISLLDFLEYLNAFPHIFSSLLCNNFWIWLRSIYLYSFYWFFFVLHLLILTSVVSTTDPFAVFFLQIICIKFQNYSTY